MKIEVVWDVENGESEFITLRNSPKVSPKIKTKWRRKTKAALTTLVAHAKLETIGDKFVLRLTYKKEENEKKAPDARPGSAQIKWTAGQSKGAASWDDDENKARWNVRKQPVNISYGLTDRRYWVVSPNVRNNLSTVDAWRRASVIHRAAFMGWPLSHKDGAKFAGITERGILAGDVILIARRNNGKPQTVGFGVVRGKRSKKLKDTPESFQSMRRLSPFVVLSRVPSRIPFKPIVQHTKALVQLHPESDDDDAEVCRWLNQRISAAQQNVRDDPGSTADSSEARGSLGNSITREVGLPTGHQLEYQVRTMRQVRNAKKIEADLLRKYQAWLKQQDRDLRSLKFGAIQCDGYESARKNLIEAKSSIKREYVRMAVGQLLDYTFLAQQEFGDSNKAILLPKEPDRKISDWLQTLGIAVIWFQKGAFVDNAEGQFS